MTVYLSGATIDAILKLHAGAAGVTENGVSKMVMLRGNCGSSVSLFGDYFGTNLYWLVVTGT